MQKSLLMYGNTSETLYSIEVAGWEKWRDRAQKHSQTIKSMNRQSEEQTHKERDRQ